jgi:hypothetical protein
MVCGPSARQWARAWVRCSLLLLQTTGEDDVVVVVTSASTFVLRKTTLAAVDVCPKAPIAPTLHRDPCPRLSPQLDHKINNILH